MTTASGEEAAAWRFDDLRALFINCTLKRSPERSRTQGLIDRGCDPGSGGPDNDVTNRNTTFATWNLHLARMLKDAGGIPAHGNQRPERDAGCRFDFDNPDYR
jgi:hypothetical protein